MFQLHEINSQVPVEPEWQWLVYWTDTQTSLGAYIRFGRSQHRLIEIFYDHMKCIFIAKFMRRSLKFFLQHSRSKASSWLGLLNPSSEYDLLDSQSTSGRSQRRLIEIFCDHMKCIFIAKFMCRSLKFFLQHSRSKVSSCLNLLNPSTEYDLLDSQSTSGRSQHKLIEIFCDRMKRISIAKFVCQSLNFFLQCSKSNVPSWVGLNPSTEHDLLDGKSTLNGGCRE